MERCLEYFMKSSLGDILCLVTRIRPRSFAMKKKTFQDVILLEFCKAVRHIERQHSKGYEVNSKEKSVTSNEYIFI